MSQRGLQGVLWVIAAVVVTGGLGEAWGQREKVGRVADCGTPNPTNADQVFACMASYRFTGGQVEGKQAFQGKTGCHGAAVFYTSALATSSGARTVDLLDKLPSCEVLAKAMTSLVGKAPYWSTCTNYPGQSTPDHIKACLDYFLPEYYGNPKKTLQTLNGCADITQQYEAALRHANVSSNGRSMGASLPGSYQKPDCTAIASLTGGKGAACGDYTPDMAHLQRCLGPVSAVHTTCPAIRQAYEGKLIQAYGGHLPPGYAALPCQQLETLVAQNVEAKAKAQSDAREILRQQAENRHAAPRNTGSADGFLGGFLASLGLGSAGAVMGSYFGPAFYFGFLVHGLLAGWALYYASRKARAGEWIQVIASAAGLFTRVFEIKLMTAHIALIGLGVWLTSWPWSVGAVLAIIFAKLIAFPLWLFGLFRNPAIPRAGRVDASGNVAPPPAAAPPAKDKGRTKDWT